MPALRPAVLLGAILIVACGSDGPGPEPGAVCAVSVVDPDNGTPLAIMTERRLEAAAEMCDSNDAPPDTVTWLSSNASVASVSTDGVVTGGARGSARISATIRGVSEGLGVCVDLPAAGQTTYTVAYIGGAFDTTFRNSGTAIARGNAGVYLTTVASEGENDGFIFLGTDDLQPFVEREYPLIGDAAPSQPRAATAYTIFNGYSANITGSLAILTVGPAETGGAFDFSAPTEGQSPEFTVRIRGSFLATPDDPTFFCH
jgi:hypothetical protein